MVARRYVIFESESFNTTEAKDYFINDCCFGDDLGRWLLHELSQRGVETYPEPGQEDFGWYVSFDVAGQAYDFVISYRPGHQNVPGDWICCLERSLGLIPSILGRRKKGIQSAAAEAIHSVLEASSSIHNVRWFSDADYATETNPRARPVGRVPPEEL